MARTESSELAAPYVLLYIWGDDHLRSAMRCRHAAIYPWWDHQGGLLFHKNFWANLLPDPRALYGMTDPDFMEESLRDDLMLQLCLFNQVDPAIIDLAAAFYREHGRHLLLLLQCPDATLQVLRGQPRYEQEIVDSIRQKDTLVDMLDPKPRTYRGDSVKPAAVNPSTRGDP